MLYEFGPVSFPSKLDEVSGGCLVPGCSDIEPRDLGAEFWEYGGEGPGSKPAAVTKL